MNVGELKELLNEWIQILEDYEEEDKIKMEGNTYWLRGAKYYLGVSGYNGGFVNLSSLEEVIERGEE